MSYVPWYRHTTATTGCHVVAPSDMMDNRVSAIKNAFEVNGFASKVRT